MKRFLCLVLLFALALALASCEGARSSLEVMREVKFIGKISGNIYFSGACEGDDEYIDPDLMGMLFFEDTPPKNFAVILSPSVDYPYEVMLVIPDDGEDVVTLADTLRRRLVLLTDDGKARPIVTAEYLAYSTAELNIDLRQTLEKIMT